MNKTVLIGTILTRSSFPTRPLRDVIDMLGVEQIFVFNVENENKFLLTYNVDKELVGTKLKELKEKYKNTLCLHRKRKHNVFYTINSLNLLEKDGPVNWSEYTGSLILGGGEEVSILKVSLKEIVRIRRKENGKKIKNESKSDSANT